VTEIDDNTPFRVALTGGIASGKSTVAKMFEALGAVVIDTDVIAREVVQRGSPALDEIRDLFGGDAIDATGNLDRAAIRNRIFADQDLRLELEAILHPRIGAETRRQADAAGGAYQIVVVPLLVDSALLGFVDRVVVVDCDEELQIQRLLARDSETVEQAKKILAAQSTREDRLGIADDVISNDRGLGETRRRVRDLDGLYRRLAARACRHEHPSETP
jgi:dephospho-CoA kinase